jgi:hypothetical protein
MATLPLPLSGAASLGFITDWSMSLSRYVPAEPRFMGAMTCAGPGRISVPHRDAERRSCLQLCARVVAQRRQRAVDERLQRHAQRRHPLHLFVSVNRRQPHAIRGRPPAVRCLRAARLTASGGGEAARVHLQRLQLRVDALVDHVRVGDDARVAGLRSGPITAQPAARRTNGPRSRAARQRGRGRCYLSEDLVQPNHGDNRGAARVVLVTPVRAPRARRPVPDDVVQDVASAHRRQLVRIADNDDLRADRAVQTPNLCQARTCTRRQLRQCSQRPL